VKILTVHGVVAPSAMFQVVATGYALGVITLFGPIFVLVAVFSLFSFPIAGSRWSILLLPIVLPLIALFQAAFIGLIVLLGLTVYRWYRPIEVISSEDRSSDATL
jgi:hypothetical protein